MWYNTVKMYFDNNHPSYTVESLKIFVKANMITDLQYTEITGEPYTA